MLQGSHSGWGLQAAFVWRGGLGSGSGFIGIGLGSGLAEPHPSVAGGACTADQACRSGAQGKWHRESLYTSTGHSLAAQVRLVCSADLRQRIRFAAGQVYRHGYFVSRGASREARTRRPQLWRHGARLFMHAALQGGQGFIATAYIDGSDEGRPLKSNGRVPGWLGV